MPTLESVDVQSIHQSWSEDKNGVCILTLLCDFVMSSI